MGVFLTVSLVLLSLLIASVAVGFILGCVIMPFIYRMCQSRAGRSTVMSLNQKIIWSCIITVLLYLGGQVLGVMNIRSI